MRRSLTCRFTDSFGQRQSILLYFHSDPKCQICWDRGTVVTDEYEVVPCICSGGVMYKRAVNLRIPYTKEELLEAGLLPKPKSQGE